MRVGAQPLGRPIDAHAARAAMRSARDGAWNCDLPASLEEVAAGVGVCRRCELWRQARQGVPGRGLARAALMLVGEQPGDAEDLAGAPFVGASGRVLDAGLRRAGVPRDGVFVTNAVKHFRHLRRGGRRAYRTPAAGEVAACRWWLEAERRLVRPKVVMALGSTAALAVFGKATPVADNRGRAAALADHAQGLVTFHPGYLLSLSDETAKREAFGLFVTDLKLAWSLAG
ncbi:MAG TPA: UdgX family uracil-DNA binding protein [Caulobacteraceae bacterium]|nr:UdgX family uracil-DNA binding protein [Caulobacteraceae bacterium]